MQKNSTYIFVTGCAGFIGFHLTKRLLDEGFNVLGIDNMNDYYDPSLKYDRLKIIMQYPYFRFVEGSIENMELLENLFSQYDLDTVVNLAAQAGVRYSLKNPHKYIQSNVVGFVNILECCKKHKIPHLIYASSSSVYGNNKNVPFSVTDRVDYPISLYAATKRANELMAYTYSHLYNLPTTGLRFFTVYGPWGRPDMALFKFANAIMKQQPIEIYNYGNMKRDFTYIDDVTESILRLIYRGPSTESPYKIYNIGNNQPVQLNYLIQVLEEHLGKKAIKKLLPMQPGDVPETFADIDELVKDINYKPKVSIEEGIKRFVEWYKDYYKKIS
ncbi:NAD-dependent epimerase [Parageobacillus sp. VR-IP]|uniref:NAD-dependent epimerase n=1 Tax=Parageobacillus sp. VR-IP TaxID=2742205 RepID=UPI001583C77A|nr:NAD-dependent epimerase [Parageobacillus sp. VR-IP]NUK30410.1 NAD-dependent epimerase [Parageobacillus sp. VR-IP]